ncbi:MAG: FctA domain-containing protein, partial [Lachnospiraceae bacterium]|nr:FctA domain-containing protein [Lachnospiraceae bacterium]
VNEVRGTLGGVTYDETIYNVEVTVTDNGVGQLEAAVAITAGGEAKEEVVFNNTYAPDDTSVVLKATKVFVDEDGKKEAMKGGEFTFQLKAADGTVLDQAVNAADGSVVFDAVTYDEEGQFTYTISEVIGNNNSIIYDKTVYTVVVVVEDNEEGKLEVVSVEYKKANAAVSEAKFVNRSEDKGIVPTGDNNHIMIWIALLGISGIGTAVLMKRKKVNK